ncbi:MAG: glyoxalase [Chloroflexota bacterium]|nr:MAG: glyoxalase [Chloroflexota bacterium]
MELHGLHHVTAVTGRAQANVDFYTQVLGMRLVKKTVNQDDVSAYHLFYGDEAGNPGTELTFFEWPQMGPNHNGPGSIAQTALRVPNREALAWWVQRLDERGVKHEGLSEFHGHALINFTDPEGQQLALVDDGGAPGGTPWPQSPVPAEYGIHGLFASTLIVRQLEPTALVLTQVMGYQLAGEYPSAGHPGERTVVFALGQGGAGKELYVVEQPNRPYGQLGIGGVHHIAFRTPDGQEQTQWMNRLHAVGLRTSGLVDRYYFQSLYFRIPGGILFEIATDGPGFATDEPAEHLGERLALPPFLEPRRAQIEAGLKPVELNRP